MFHLKQTTLVLAVIGAVAVSSLGRNASAQSKPATSPTPKVSPTATVAATPVATVAPTPTAAPTETATPVATVEPTPTATATPVATASPVAAATPAASPAAAVDTPAPQLPDSTATAANSGSSQDLIWPVPAKTMDNLGKATAPTPLYADPTNTELVNNVAHNKISINVVWTLITGFLVMFMQAGFALVETGLCRAKNAAHVMSTNFMIYGLGMLGFWMCGFAIMFGGFGSAAGAIGSQPGLGQGVLLLNNEFTVTLFGKPFGLWGMKGFFLNPAVFDSAILTLFLFEMVFMDTTATIPTGAMAERWNFKNFVVYGFWIGMFPYALFGNWVWGGGWLSQLGMNFGLGHGHVDFAGSSVVHMCGGMIALAGGKVIGPRLGKYGPDGKPRPMPGHDIPMVMLGTFILAFGWFGFNPGSTLQGTDMRIAVVAVNTMLAGAAASFATMVTMYLVTGKPDPSMLCNGLLAGLVAITAPCAFVNPLGAVLLGGIAGVIVVFSVFFVERTLRVDDPVGAISVHGVCGAWGVLSVGIFANGSYGQGWNGVHKLVKDGAVQIINNTGADMVAKYNEMVATTGPNGGWTDVGVTGVLGKFFGAPAGDASQLGAQLVGTLTCLIFVTTTAFIWFKVSNVIFPLRSTRADEIAGLDIPEMGAEAYPDFHLTDKTSPPVS